MKEDIQGYISITHFYSESAFNGLKIKLKSVKSFRFARHADRV